MSTKFVYFWSNSLEHKVPDDLLCVWVVEQLLVEI